MKSLPLISLYLRSLVTITKMTPISKPFCYKFPGEDSGVTGFQMLGESHVSIHTYPENSFAYIDIFSCKSFEIDPVISFTKKFWGSKTIKQITIVRTEPVSVIDSVATEELD